MQANRCCGQAECVHHMASIQCRVQVNTQKLRLADLPRLDVWLFLLLLPCRKILTINRGAREGLDWR